MIRTERLRYDGPGGPFEGTLAWRDDGGVKPAVLVSHAYGGQGPFDDAKAVALAELGYVGFALDLYGVGRRAASPAEAETLMAALDADRVLLAARMHAALAASISQPMVDASRVAAIGFCFGGKCVLDLARSGAPVRGVASFHGLYDPPPADVATAGRIDAAVLVLHGWDDPLSSPDALVALGAELTRRGADWQLVAYGHTGHSFTNPKAQAPERGMFYSARAAEHAWAATTRFLAELFAR